MVIKKLLTLTGIAGSDNDGIRKVVLVVEVMVTTQVQGSGVGTGVSGNDSVTGVWSTGGSGFSR